MKIKTTSQKLKNELENIPVEKTPLATMEGHVKGTSMSPCNLVAYLIGWGELVLKWHRIKAQGKETDFPETGYQWNELGKLAQKFYRDYKNDSYSELLQKFDDLVNSILGIIEKEDNHTLYETLWYKKYTLGRMIQLNTISPYKNACSRIRKWKKQQPPEKKLPLTMNLKNPSNS